ncbi:MAG: hypothetical protein ACRC2K_13330 [Clostridium sp.]
MTAYKPKYNLIKDMCKKQAIQFDGMNITELEKFNKLNLAGNLNQKKVNRLNGVSVLLLQESINEYPLVTNSTVLIKPLKTHKNTISLKKSYNKKINIGGKAN